MRAYDSGILACVVPPHFRTLPLRVRQAGPMSGYLLNTTAHLSGVSGSSRHARANRQDCSEYIPACRTRMARHPCVPDRLEQGRNTPGEGRHH